MRLARREELHADDIEQVLAFFAVQQRRIGEQGRSLAARSAPVPAGGA